MTEGITRCKECGTAINTLNPSARDDDGRPYSPCKCTEAESVKQYLIGQRVIYGNVICQINGIDDENNQVKIWVDNPDRKYSHWVSPGNIRPLPGGQL